MQEKTLPSNLSNPETRKKWEEQKGRLADPVLRAQAIAARKAKEDAAFRDPQAYLKRLFNTPKKGGCTIKVTCSAIEAATRRLSEYMINHDFTGADGDFNIKEYLSVLENLKKTIAFLDELNSAAAGKAINNMIRVESMTINNTSKTGGAVGSIMDIEPARLSELTSNEQR
jgi:hypothetical protein